MVEGDLAPLDVEDEPGGNAVRPHSLRAPAAPSWKCRRLRMGDPVVQGAGPVIALAELQLAALTAPGPAVAVPTYPVLQAQPDLHP